MAVKDHYLKWVLEQLAGVEGVTARRMFGAVGLYRGSTFFAIISGDTLYFKADDANRADYETRGMTRFHPFKDKSRLSMNYYEVPADVIEDADTCVEWANRAAAAGATKIKPAPLRKPGKRRPARGGRS